MPGNSYIAFRYKTASNCINIFLDNMQLSGNAPSAINDPAQAFQPEIDLSALTAGVYFVELVDSRQQKSIHRIVKQ